MPDLDPTARRKRLLLRSRYRGFLESDIIFRRFAEAVLPDLGESDLDRYEALLDEPDHDLYAWVTGARAIPARHDHGVMRRLRVLNGTLPSASG